MNYDEFLVRVIDEGIAACRESYKHDKMKRDGAVAGFKACRDKNPIELAALLEDAHKQQNEAFRNPADDYWRVRCYEAEIEWVCNVISAMLYNQKLPVIVPPTYRGLRKAADIVGVAS